MSKFKGAIQRVPKFYSAIQHRPEFRGAIIRDENKIPVFPALPDFDPIFPDVPDVPITADYYLYGTPSESGNVALADGDGYVADNGAALPNIDTVYTDEIKATHPYVVVQYIDTDLAPNAHIARVICASEPIVWQSLSLFKGGLGLKGDVLYFGLVTNALLWEWLFPDVDPTTPVNTWAKSGENHYDELTDFNPAASPEGFKWANHDVINISKDSVFISALPPIPLASNEPVAAVCGGEKLPVLPEWEGYNYKVVYRIGSKYYVRAYQNSPITGLSTPLFPNEEPHDLLRAEGDWHSSHIDDSGNWYKNDTTSTDGVGMSLLVSTIVWANVDVFTSSGELYIPASDPIPVYEQKE